MPGKKSSKGKGKKSSKGKGKKGKKGKGKSDATPVKRTPEGFLAPAPGTAGAESLGLYRAYISSCKEVHSEAMDSVLAPLREAVEGGKTINRFVFQDESVAGSMTLPGNTTGGDSDDEDNSPGTARKSAATPSRAAALGSDSEDGSSEDDDDDEDDDPGFESAIPRREKALWPFLLALERSGCKDIEHIHAWFCDLTDQAIAILGRHVNKFLDHPEPLNKLKTLDLAHCTISAWSASFLSRSIPLTHLKALCLDYVPFGLEGCGALSASLRGNFTLESLSMDSCGLRANCGRLLGQMLPYSALKDLSLEGNSLECEGILFLLQPFMCRVNEYLAYTKAKRELEDAVSAHRLEQETRRQGVFRSPSHGQPEQSEEPPAECELALQRFSFKVPPPPMPMLSRIVISGNSADCYGKAGKQGPAIMMEVVTMMVEGWEPLAELHFHNNRFGDYPAFQLLEGLERRKQAGHKDIYVTVTPYIQIDTLKAIKRLSAKPPGGKKKKKKGRGKAKGKAKGKKKKKKK
ncbi:uncharacterized protein LOC135817432 [Sycon ciliatum]|uniref:uncharacterized protein LOC135817432 n=1 Tax=Sycon ciliatum TaxID=27933 RepID=UPI0031F6C434